MCIRDSSSSLEKTLLVGDYLLVSKFHYGARTPMTTIGTPMLHDSIPKVGVKSYLSTPQLPYFRLPGFQKIKRNDIVVFSWPVDTLIDIRPINMSGSVRKPVDKKSNYVKRCVGMPGDSLEVRNGYVYINGKQNDLPDRARLQYSYKLVSKEPFVTGPRDRNGYQYTPTDLAFSRYDISDISGIRDPNSGAYYQNAHMTEESYAKIKNNTNVIAVERNTYVKGETNSNLFPHNYNNWTVDNYGSIYIPEKGKTVEITQETIPYYKRIIEVYEGYEMGENRTIDFSGTQVLLNGSPITEYTFKQDYYWLMGDNRHNSQDARTWGFVPYNHVVGKPVFVWFSMDNNPHKTGFFSRIRWDRVFTTVSGSGKPTSFKWVLFVLIGLFVASFFKKKKPEAK